MNDRCGLFFFVTFDFFFNNLQNAWSANCFSNVGKEGATLLAAVLWGRVFINSRFLQGVDEGLEN